MSKHPQTVYLYKVETSPPIRPDANKTWARVIKTLTRQLENSIGLITHRNDTLWGSIKSKDTSFIISTILKKQRRPPQQQNPNPNQRDEKYELKITRTKEILFENMFEEGNKTIKPLFVQMVNIKIKQTLSNTGYEEMGKGRFYNRGDIGKKA